MIAVDPTTKCWLWTGATKKDGYGQIFRDKKNQRVHRYVYEQTNGPIKPGYDVHHTCKVKLCVNPEHMEVLSKDEHKARHPRTGNKAALIAPCTGCGLPPFICEARVASGGICTPRG